MLHTILDAIDALSTIGMMGIGLSIVYIIRSNHRPTVRGLRLTGYLMGLTAVALFCFDLALSLGVDPLAIVVWRKHIGRPLLFLALWAFWRWLFGVKKEDS